MYIRLSKSIKFPFKPCHTHKIVDTVLQFAANQTLIRTDLKGLLGSCCIAVSVNLDKDSVRVVKNDLPNPFVILSHNCFYLYDFLVSRDVKRLAVIVLTACSACLAVTRCQSQSYNFSAVPLNLGNF